MGDKEKEAKKEKYQVTEYDFVLVNDSLLMFIGISLITLGFVNLFVPIPLEYQIGVSISAFFFVMADLLSFKPTLNTAYLNVYKITLISAVMSFFLLPILLIVYQVQIPYLSRMASGMSFVSLGIVLGVLNIKSQQKTRETTMEIYQEHKELTKLHEDIKVEWDRKMNMFEKQSVALENEMKRKIQENENLRSEIDEIKEQVYKTRGN